MTAILALVWLAPTAQAANTPTQDLFALATPDIRVTNTNAAPVVVAAFYDFDASGTPENYPRPNYLAPGFSGGVTKGKTSWDSGGSNDGTLGYFLFADGKFENPPDDGDGHLQIGLEPFSGMPFPEWAGPAVIRVSNSSGMACQLQELHYDAAAQNPAQEAQLWYSLTGAAESLVQLGSSGAPIAVASSGGFTDYGNYSECLGGLTLACGASIYLKFAATADTILIDNHRPRQLHNRRRPLSLYSLESPGEALSAFPEPPPPKAATPSKTP